MISSKRDSILSILPIYPRKYPGTFQKKVSSVELVILHSDWFYLGPNTRVSRTNFSSTLPFSKSSTVKMAVRTSTCRHTMPSSPMVTLSSPSYSTNDAPFIRSKRPTLFWHANSIASYELHNARHQPLNTFFSRAKLRASQDIIDRNITKFCNRVSQFVGKTLSRWVML